MTRQQAYAIVTAIINKGRSSVIAKQYPELAKCVTKDNYVDVKRFNKRYPAK